ncbi:ABC transporter ATP-binding protein [Vagococcus vulneris]|uniref:ABC transporter domain-containing protein n=1 Tax=Vagococcus vulneris TaxID=1977869 RepID=A0A429ZZK7_9ENTE|nr:ABC transporter ATP-binding protein [Vagococcus vulneris]RST99488.1 hypothetical protein CBF37_03960 [Vagococcus vulneris]
MIKLINASVSYDKEKVLHELNLNIGTGECLVLCGESGSGKSSIIKMLTGLMPELYPGKISGDVQVNQIDVPPKDIEAYVKNIGVVFQNPKTQFFTSNVYAELAFSLENHGVAVSDMKDQIDKISKDFHLIDYLGDSMFQLSGGEKQRVAFASVCMLERSVYLLDEPSSNLDESTIRIIIEYIHWLKKQGATIIVAEHRLSYLTALADRFIYLSEGSIINDWTAEELLQLSDKEVHQKGLRSLNNVPVCLKDNGQNISRDTANRITLNSLKLKKTKSSNTFSLKLDNIFFDSSAVTGIIGQNGSGKSTLAQLLTGLVKPDSGEVKFNQQVMSQKDLLKKSFLVMQDVNFQLFFESVYKELTAKARRLDMLEDVVDKLQLHNLMDRHPQTLSGGEKQRVAIGSAVLSGKQIIILDEPTSGLDLKNMYEVSSLIEWLQKLGLIVIVITHDIEFLNCTCHRVIEMSHGKIVKNV